MADHHHYNGGGIGIGTILAFYLSWITWHSIGWGLVNACFGWLYVIYWALKYWK